MPTDWEKRLGIKGTTKKDDWEKRLGINKSSLKIPSTKGLTGTGSVTSIAELKALKEQEEPIMQQQPAIQPKPIQTQREYISPKDDIRIQPNVKTSKELFPVLQPNWKMNTVSKDLEKVPALAEGYNSFLLGAPEKIDTEQGGKTFEKARGNASTVFTLPEVKESKYTSRKDDMTIDIKAQPKQDITTSHLGGVAGNLLKYGTLYSAVGPAIEGIKPLQAISNPLAKMLATEGTKDLLIGGGITGAEGLIQGKSGKEIASELPGNLLVDTIANAGFYGLGKILKPLAQAPQIPSRQVLEETDDIIRELGLPKGTTAKDLMQQLEQTAKDIQAENYYTQLEKQLGIPQAPTLKQNTLNNTKPLPQQNEVFKSNLGMEEAAVTALKEPPIVTVPKPRNLQPVPDPIKINPNETPLKFAQSVQNSELASTKLKKMIKENPLSEQPITNRETLQYAQNIVNSNFDEALRVIKQGDSFDNPVEVAMAQDVIRRLQNNAKSDSQWQEVFDVMETTAKKARTAGQSVQAFSMWSRLTPDGMLAYARRTIEKANESLPDVKKLKLTGEFAEEITKDMQRIQEPNADLLKIIQEQSGSRGINVSKSIEKDLQAANPDKLKDIAIAQVLGKISDKVPQDTAKKLSTFQAISHLLNPKTIIRNVLGNTVFGAAEQVSNVYGTAWDALLATKTGKRSVGIPKLKGALEEGLKQAKEKNLDISLRIDRNNVGKGKYDIPTSRSFSDGVLGKGEELLQRSLQVPDEFAKGYIKQSTKSQLEAIGGFTAKEIEEIAEQQARYATFQDNSKIAQVFQSIKDTFNKIGVGKTARGSSGMMTKEFGVGDFLIKYTTVPGNLITRGIEYSPAGFVKALTALADGNKSGLVKQRDIALTLGRATNGSLMLGMGVLLNRLGLITSEDKSRDRDALALDRAEGKGNAKVNITGLTRLLNGSNPSPQKGDIFESFDWIQPVSIAFEIGATLDNEIKKQDKNIQAVWTTGQVALEEMLDIPTLNIIKQMTYADGIFDKAITPVVEGISGFVPAPIRQTAQLLDPVARNTYDSDPIKRSANRLKSALPGLRQTLEPRLTPFGEEIKYPNNLLESFINPAQTTKFNPSIVTPQLQKLEDLTGETRQYPQSKAPKSFTHKKQKIELTPQEQTTFQKIAGQETLNSYERIIGNKDVEGMSDAGRERLIKELEKAKEQARDKAKLEILRGR